MTEGELDETPELTLLYSQSTRTRRRELHPMIRHVCVAVFGAAVALASFYLLRELGY